ncbi:efflux RND transporter permease subunit [Paraburkholderia sp. Ac-20347]|uniref:efflux RND transporter permease subunit n=1 Tax=Paraburkholderia sp. Ac-20347 TaxID=2703892 RepID=UPI001981A2C2|nr:efflux RND transporter permease subunit [Paraburkholderia sp. Ac-20347]MBN3807707.1 efflux RND transporter permease subunit [Paraburkholderia sp. Ac-20347]
MNLARTLIERPLIAWIIALVSLIGGIIAYIDIGRLEDPKFTIKTAVVVTLYPGASAKQVESEVTDRIESAVQQLEQVDFIRSRSMAGYSEVRIQIRDQYMSNQLQQIWEQLRRQISDLTPRLPPGAGPPIVLDRFGDVYGLFYAITGKGYSQAQLFDYARELRKDLLTLPDVADIVIAGNQQQQVTVTADQSLLVANNLSSDDIAQALGVQNEVRSAGRERVGDQLIRISPTGTLDTLASVRALPVGTTPGELLLGDVARVNFGYASIPTQAIRYNGQDALTIGISARSGVNVVKVGDEVKAKLKELERVRPLGIELHVLYDQPDSVDAAVRGFVLDVMLSVGIVTVALGIGLGWRAGVVLGIELFLSILGTLFVMYAAGIELQRISLGALIIVMGMLTDNSIVVCEGMLVRVQKGLSHIEAAAEVLKQGQWLLLASTVVGILAFSGIGMSPDAVGEFCASLFAVAAISLLFSWVIAIALTPLLGFYFFKRSEGEQKNPFDTRLYRQYGRLLGWVERRRLWVIGSMVVLLVVCIWGFRFVEQSFFPASTNPIFYVDMRLPRGVDIRTVMERTRGPEKLLLAQPGVESVGTYIGGGATRFILVYDPETQDPSYAQFIVTVDDAARIDTMIPKLDHDLRKQFPDVNWSVTRPNFGPSSGLPIQARFLGPDPAVLRKLGAQAEAVLRKDGGLQSISNDWENRVNVVRPVFDDTRARSLGVTRRQLNDTFAYATEGLRVGLFRDEDLLLPIVLNEPPGMGGIERLQGLQIYSLGQRRYVPMADVLGGVTYGTEDGVIARRDRIRTLTVSAGTLYGENSVAAFDRVRAPIEAIAPPPGYELEWGGEYESSNKAKESLFTQLPIGFAGMLLLVLFMFGRLKPALIVLLVVPMSICGVTIGLLAFRGAFGFMSLLGLLSLIGMLIKNGVVLVDEIDLQIASGVPRMRAVIDGSKSRLRPVALAAGTTILGMVPLLWDPFFKDMAITMMAGLAFATVLTMAAVPALYVLFFSIRSDETEPGAADGERHEAT